MRIGKKDKINNIPVIKIRNYFREMRIPGISKADLAKHFDLDIKAANSLIKELLQNDFIEKTSEEDLKNGTYVGFYFVKLNEYQLTDKGFALCAAHSNPPINKEKADKILAEFMERIEEINNNDYYLCKVNKLLLFGSYLNSDNKDYGDIDIAYELKRKIEDYDEYTKARKMRIKKMEDKGKFFRSFDEELNYPEREVKLKMKNKCRYISLQPIEDWFLKIVKYKQIYPVKGQRRLKSSPNPHKRNPQTHEKN